MNKKIGMILLVLALLLTSTVVYVEPTFAGSIKPLHEQAEEDAEKAAELDARYAALEDFALGKPSNYSLSLRTEKEIVERYKLHLDLPAYRAVFLERYRYYFKAYYIGEYIQERTNAALSSDGTDLGMIIGEAAGAVEALTDYIYHKKNDWRVAFDRFLRKNSLKRRYNLDKHNADFVDRFKHGFEEGFKKSYTESYNKILTEIHLQNLVVSTINNNATNVTSDSYSYTAADGSLTATKNITFSLQFDAGTIFEQTMVNVEMEQFSFNTRNYRYAPVSNVFKVTLNNKSGNYHFRRPTTLEFSYKGSEKIGIYEWKNYRWEYLPTVQTEKAVRTIIPAGDYYGGRYALFIDDNFEPIRDIAFSFARDEINVFARRHYISAGSHFNPSAQVTRAQMAVFLYELLKSRFPSGGSHLEAKDRASYGYAATAIDFVISNRFMNLDKDKYFHPHVPVTFEHLQYIYKNIMQEPISWIMVAKKIKQDEYFYSDALDDITKPATREEAVYFLYHYIDK